MYGQDVSKDYQIFLKKIIKVVPEIMLTLLKVQGAGVTLTRKIKRYQKITFFHERISFMDFMEYIYGVSF